MKLPLNLDLTFKAPIKGGSEADKHASNIYSGHFVEDNNSSLSKQNLPRLKNPPRGESPSQGDLTRRWHLIRESARHRGAVVQDDTDTFNQNVRDLSRDNSIDTSEMYPAQKLPPRRNKYRYVTSKVDNILQRPSYRGNSELRLLSIKDNPSSLQASPHQRFSKATRANSVLALKISNKNNNSKVDIKPIEPLQQPTGPQPVVVSRFNETYDTASFTNRNQKEAGAANFLDETSAYGSMVTLP